MNREFLASRMESRIYETTRTYEAVQNLCYEAMRFGFASIQVFPNMIQRCLETLDGGDVAVNALISYPHGGLSIGQKAAEALDAARRGAREVEVVMNTREAKSGDFDYLKREMGAVKEAVGPDVTVKFNIEIEYLSEEEILATCRAAVGAGIDYLCTSTGLYHALDAQKRDVPLTADPKEVALLCKALAGSGVKVQAEGYISNGALARSLIEAGAARISSEYAVQVLKSWEEKE